MYHYYYIAGRVSIFLMIVRSLNINIVSYARVSVLRIVVKNGYVI